MASNRARRIAKEIADIHADTHSQITAEPVGGGDDLTHLRGTFRGPPGTPYEGGTYKVDIKIPPEYPFRPPIMKFETKVWHPNVSSQTVSQTLAQCPGCRSRCGGGVMIADCMTGCYMPGYPLDRLVACSDHQVCTAISSISAQHA